MHNSPSSNPFQLPKEEVQAFPSHGKNIMETETGMTLRDYFAGQVLISEVREKGKIVEHIVEDCYMIADAMLVERKKGTANAE